MLGNLTGHYFNESNVIKKTEKSHPACNLSHSEHSLKIIGIPYVLYFGRKSPLSLYYQELL